MSAEAEQRQTAIGVFKLLREFSIIRRRAVLDIDEYESHFWLHTLPTGLDSYNSLYDDDRDIDGDVWLEIQRREEPTCPHPPVV